MKVYEIYTSVQGETHQAGRPCTLVRFAACDLRCGYCDTEYAFSGGTERSIDDIVADVERRGVRLVLLTGGEPLLQRDLGALAARLLAQGFEVTLETSGAHDIARLPREIVKILDIKTPGSGEAGRNLWANLLHLDRKDAVKFVLTSEDDYRFALGVIRERALAERTQVLLSPAWGMIDPRDLVAWMLRDHVDARLNLQIHKYVWGPDARQV
jgi:7-carboxy-7-deazaguanine synthase